MTAAGGGALLACGESRAADIPTGEVTDVDVLGVALDRVTKAQKLTVTLALKGTPYRNRYGIWVYPPAVHTTVPGNVVMTRTFGPTVEAALVAGARVLLLADPWQLAQAVAMAFQTGFWSPMFRKKPGRLSPLGVETPGTQGILCDPKHPLFRDFPTEFHTNWQWWRLVKQSRAMVLDATPPAFRPLVQVIDGFDRNHKLGLVWEARVGKGRLLVCSIDLPALQEHPEARQLLACLCRYAGGSDFAPRCGLTATTVRELVK